jgi:hypothetical protein
MLHSILNRIMYLYISPIITITNLNGFVAQPVFDASWQ